MNPTDNVTKIANRYGMSRADVRAIARDLDIPLDYSKARHAWVLATDARTVRMFNDHLAGA